MIGTAGHIDHGKTELVAALTHESTDRLPEERERGISIDLGFARLELGEARPDASVVDVPGHEGFVRNMVAGATGIDAVLFVVAADEGMMPQSLEHLLVLEALGVEAGVVAVTKADRVEPAWLELVVETVEESLSGSPLAAAPVIATSTRDGRGIEAVRGALAEAVAAAPPRPGRDLPFRMPVDRAFTLTGVGTVVTGTVWSGEVGQGATVRVFGVDEAGDLRARVRSIEIHGRPVAGVAAGRRAALALTGIDAGAVGRGAVLVDPDPPWRSSVRVDAAVWLADRAPDAVERGDRVRIHQGTREVMARAFWYGSEPVVPGGEGVVRLDLESPLVVAVGDRLVVRTYSPMETIGGGTVLALDPPRSRGSERALRGRRLEALVGATPSRRLAHVLAAAGGAGVRVAELPLVTGLDPGALASLREETHEVHGDRWFDPAAGRAAEARIRAAVERHHAEVPLDPGLSLEAARRAGRADPALVEAAIDGLVHAGALTRNGAILSLAGREVELTSEQRRLVEGILTAMGEADLEPPDTLGLAATLGVGVERLRPLLAHLERTGDLVKLRSDWYADGDAVERAGTAVAERITASGPADVGTLKELLGVSRKYLIPLLEHLDESGLTRREGDQRVLAESAG